MRNNTEVLMLFGTISEPLGTWKDDLNIATPEFLFPSCASPDNIGLYESFLTSKHPLPDVRR